MPIKDSVKIMFGKQDVELVNKCRAGNQWTKIGVLGSRAN